MRAAEWVVVIAWWTCTLPACVGAGWRVAEITGAVIGAAVWFVLFMATI